MAGLDNIIEQILKSSEDAAEKTLSAARKEAEELLAKADKETEQEIQAIRLRSEQNTADILARGSSGANLRYRQGLLACRQRLIQEVLSEALEHLKNLETKDYFDTVIRLAKKSALPKEGQIYFSRKDLLRLPAGFEAALNDALKETGGILHISDIPKDLDGGFILSYGGIEENCSFDALFDSERDALKDLVYPILFP